MRKRLRKAIKHPLVSGSAILFIGFGTANVFNYLFNLGMGRMLSVADYGTLAVLISIINISHVFSSSVVTVFTKFTATFVGQKQEGALWILFKKGTLWVGVGAIIIAGSIILLDSPISHFLNIRRVILTDIVGLVVLFALLSSVSYGILQGQLKLIYYSSFLVFSSLLKFFLGLAFVFMGLSIFGAVGAIFISVFIEYVLLFFLLYRSLKKTKRKDAAIHNLHGQLYLYGLPVFLTGLGITALTTLDIILVKHFLSPVIAGQYAALSLMGRSIFYLVLPVLSVFFPLIAQKNARGERLSGTLLLSVFLVSIILITLSTLYFLFPGLILRVFFPGKSYASLASYLGPFSIFVIFYTFSWLFKSFFLSIGKTRIFIFTLTAAFLQGLFITFFHQDMSQIIFGITSISFLLLISFLLYYLFTIGSQDNVNRR